MTFSQFGVVESSWSASQTFAPEFRALIVIFRSVGPVISTLRSINPGASAATFQERSSRIALVSSRNESSLPLAIAAIRSLRFASSSKRLGFN